MVLGTIHPLESDGVSSTLFEHLAKENKALSSARVWVPSTVHFEQGFAKAWYYSEKVTRPDETDGNKPKKYAEVKKRTGKECDLESIKYCMTRGCDDGEICAQFLSISGRDHLDKTEVTYMTPAMLRDFLSSQGQKPRGLLQKFVKPKGQNNNTIVATWSPCLLVTEMRRNKHYLFDRHVDVSRRAATFESQSDYCTTSSCGEGVNALVKECCEQIVSHFLSTEHLCIVRMVLYFKVDNSSKLRLLFSSSIRIVEIKNTSKDISIPVNLSVKMVATEQKRRRNDERGVNRKQSLPADLGPLIAHEGRRMKMVRQMKGCDIEFFGERGAPYVPLRRSPKLSPSMKPANVSPTAPSPMMGPTGSPGAATNRPRPLQTLQSAMQSVSCIRSGAGGGGSPGAIDNSSFDTDPTGLTGGSVSPPASGWCGEGGVRLTPVVRTPKGVANESGTSPLSSMSPGKFMVGGSSGQGGGVHGRHSANDLATRRADWGEWLQRHRSPGGSPGSPASGLPPKPQQPQGHAPTPVLKHDAVHPAAAAAAAHPHRHLGRVSFEDGGSPGAVDSELDGGAHANAQIATATATVGTPQARHRGQSPGTRSPSTSGGAPVAGGHTASPTTPSGSVTAPSTAAGGRGEGDVTPAKEGAGDASADDSAGANGTDGVGGSLTPPRVKRQVVSPMRSGSESPAVSPTSNHFVYYYGAGQDVYMNRKMDAGGTGAEDAVPTPTQGASGAGGKRGGDRKASAAAAAPARRPSSPGMIEQEEREMKRRKEVQREAAREKREVIHKKRLFMQQQRAEKLPSEVADIPGPDKSILLTHPMFHPKQGAGGDGGGTARSPQSAAAGSAGGTHSSLMEIVATNNSRLSPTRSREASPRAGGGARGGSAARGRFAEQSDAEEFRTVTPLDGATGIFVHQRTTVRSATPTHGARGATPLATTPTGSQQGRPTSGTSTAASSRGGGRCGSASRRVGLGRSHTPAGAGGAGGGRGAAAPPKQAPLLRAGLRAPSAVGGGAAGGTSVSPRASHLGVPLHRKDPSGALSVAHSVSGGPSQVGGGSGGGGLAIDASAEPGTHAPGYAASQATPVDSDSDDGHGGGGISAKRTRSDVRAAQDADARKRTISLEPPPPPPTQKLNKLRKDVTQYLQELVYVLYSSLIATASDIYIEAPAALPALTTDILMSALARFSPVKVNTVDYCLQLLERNDGRKVTPPYCDSEDEEEPQPVIPWPMACARPAKVKRKRDPTTLKRAQRLEKVQRRLDRILYFKSYVEDRVPNQRTQLLRHTSNDIMKQWRPVDDMAITWFEPVEVAPPEDPDDDPPKPEDLIGPVVEGTEPSCHCTTDCTGLVIKHTPGNVMVAKNGGAVDTMLDALFSPAGEIYYNVAVYLQKEALAKLESEEKERGANFLASVANESEQSKEIEQQQQGTPLQQSTEQPTPAVPAVATPSAPA